MKYLLFVFNFTFCTYQLFAQQPTYIIAPSVMIENKPNEEELAFSATTDIQSILSYLYSETYKEQFITKVPAGYPLDKQIAVTSHFGVRNHPVHQVIKFHRGTDLKSQTGDIVFATGEGKVIQCGFDEHLGNFVKVQHSYGFESIYGHLSAISVKKGQKVSNETKVGKVGATGTVTGPHLHYTIKKNGVFLDPFEFLYLTINE